MRFHLGFSKSIKTKTIVKFFIALGFLIFARLMLGFQVVNAESTYTNINITSASFFSLPTIDYLSGDDDLTEPHSVMVNMYKETNQKRFYFKSNNAKYEYQPYAFTSGFENTSSNYWYPNRQTQDNTFDITNNNYCTNSSTSLKSMTIEFFLKVATTMKHDFSTFNQSNVDDIFDVRIMGLTSNFDNDLLSYNTTCSKTRVDNGVSTTSGEYLISCTNFFQGNNDISIPRFRIDIMNSIPFNDRFINDSSNYGIVVRWEIYENSYNNSTFVMRYSCSDDEPVLDNGPGHGDDDPAGFDDVYDRMREHFTNNEEYSGISKSLELPNSVGDLATLPINFLQTIFDNGDLTCSNYELDFSSIGNYWLSSYNINDFKVKLPCMRTLLYSKLGTLYTLADTLLACLVFFTIAKNIFVFVDLLTEGEDLYSYYFTNSDDDTIEGHKANAYVNHKTGEVKFRR